LKLGKNDKISEKITLNPNIPINVLVERFKKYDNVSIYIADDDRMPVDILEDYLKLGKDDKITFGILENSKMPSKAKLTWRLKTGYRLEGLK